VATVKDDDYLVSAITCFHTLYDLVLELIGEKKRIEQYINWVAKTSTAIIDANPFLVQSVTKS
jgi:hypothetical protein